MHLYLGIANDTVDGQTRRWERLFLAECIEDALNRFHDMVDPWKTGEVIAVKQVAKIEARWRIITDEEIMAGYNKDWPEVVYE